MIHMWERRFLVDVRATVAVSEALAAVK